MQLSEPTLEILRGGTQGPLSLVHNNWDRSTIYSGDEHFALVEINGDVTEDTQTEYEAVKDANARKIALVNALADVAVKAAGLRAAENRHGALSEQTIPLLEALDAALAALDAAAMEAGR
jgi:hypothetical protein